MTRTLLLGAALAFGLATAANAGIAPAPVGKTESLVSKVAEGCGRRAERQVPSDVRRPRVPTRLPSGPGTQALLAQRVRDVRTSIERGGRAKGSAAFILWPHREGPTEEASRNRQSRRYCSSGSLAQRRRHDPQAYFRQIPALFPQEETEDRPAAQSRHFRHARGGGEARARGAVFQAALGDASFRSAGASRRVRNPYSQGRGYGFRARRGACHHRAGHIGRTRWRRPE